MSQSSESITPCAICAAALTAGAGYMVRIDIFADPAWSDSEFGGSHADIQESLADIINQAASMSADDLQDGVHRRFEYRVCSQCQRKLLANPLGLPRISRDASN
jgi:hypothetical protein